MGLSDWIASKIFSEKTLDSLIEKLEPRIQGQLDVYAKQTVVTLLEDEEIARGLITYLDAIYGRYQKKFFGAIGGTQKGINATMQNLDINPLATIIDEDGNFNLRQALGFFLSGGLKKLGQATPAPTTAEYISKY